MADFFSIGMTKSEVMSKLGSTKATEKTKQFIQNFWNADIDGKVTNEIELAMLDSWASGSEKVKMPTKGTTLLASSPKTDNGLNIFTYRSGSGNKDIFEVITQKTSGKAMMTDASWQGNNQKDILFDLDCDGYADCREFKTDAWDVNPSHKDENMDGNLVGRNSKEKIQKKSLLGEPKSYESIDITF